MAFLAVALQDAAHAIVVGDRGLALGRSRVDVQSGSDDAAGSGRALDVDAPLVAQGFHRFEEVVCLRFHLRVADAVLIVDGAAIAEGSRAVQQEDLRRRRDAESGREARAVRHERVAAPKPESRDLLTNGSDRILGAHVHEEKRNASRRIFSFEASESGTVAPGTPDT